MFIDSFLSVDVVAARLRALCGLFASGASILPATMLFKGENGAFQCVPEMAKNAFFVIFETYTETSEFFARSPAPYRKVT